MNRIRIRTPARLHFGLLGWGPGAQRQFGGLGLMIEAPELAIAAEIAETDTFSTRQFNPEKLRTSLETIRANLASISHVLPPVRFTFESELPPHHGLGSGTQLALAMAEASAVIAGATGLDKSELVSLVARYPRSGVGTHGYFSGGLIVDEGHPTTPGQPTEPAKLSCRCDWPPDWRVVTIFPQELPGPSGRHESAAFDVLAAPSAHEIRQVSDLVRREFLPAVESPAPGFEAAMLALESIQSRVGRWFAPAQGGHVFGSGRRDRLISDLRELGLRGLGQSSWGPTLYGFSTLGKTFLENRLTEAFGSGQGTANQIRWQITKADNRGREIRR